jgi:hypothetical protein
MNAVQVLAYSGLHLVPPPSLGEECLQDVHLQHGHADNGYGLEDCVPEQSAMGKIMSIKLVVRPWPDLTYFCVDLTTEKPRFSCVW